MSTPANFPAVCEMLRDLQRDYREDPFFADLFGSRAAGFMAASGAVRPELMSEISIEQVEWSWRGLCDILQVPEDSQAESLEDLFEESGLFDG